MDQELNRQLISILRVLRSRSMTVSGVVSFLAKAGQCDIFLVRYGGRLARRVLSPISRYVEC